MGIKVRVTEPVAVGGRLEGEVEVFAAPAPVLDSVVVLFRAAALGSAHDHDVTLHEATVWLGQGVETTSPRTVFPFAFDVPWMPPSANLDVVQVVWRVGARALWEGGEAEDTVEPVFGVAGVEPPDAEARWVALEADRRAASARDVTNTKVDRDSMGWVSVVYAAVVVVPVSFGLLGAVAPWTAALVTGVALAAVWGVGRRWFGSTVVTDDRVLRATPGGALRATIPAGMSWSLRAVGTRHERGTFTHRGDRRTWEDHSERFREVAAGAASSAVQELRIQVPDDAPGQLYTASRRVLWVLRMEGPRRWGRATVREVPVVMAWWREPPGPLG